MMPDDFDTAAALLTAARTPEEIFGADGQHAYRIFAKLVHPDRVPAARAADAAVAFARLTVLWNAFHGGPVTVTTRRASYRVGPVTARDDVADHHRAWTDDADVTVKLARRPADNDLIRREAAALRKIARAVDDKHRAYFPVLRESFVYREEGGADRVATVCDEMPGCVGLDAVREAYPGGLDMRDAAWMWRRLLVALGAAHRAGVVHGAVLPENVLIQPDAHGVALVNWCYSAVEAGDRIPAIVARYRDWYPPEVAAKREPSAATDIHLATKTMVALIGERLPAPVALFARGCTIRAQAGRPDDAWRLLAELDELLERLYGPRRFRPFAMPER
jgi:hypothetical protein